MGSLFKRLCARAHDHLQPWYEIDGNAQIH